MERQPHHQDGQPQPERLSDAELAERGIADARAEGRPIDDATARRLASLLHGGQASALYALASAGALPGGPEDELAATARELPDCRDWTDALLGYMAARGADRDRRDGWSELTTDDQQLAIEHARIRASRERRARRALFERYVALGIDPGDAEAVIEHQDLMRQQRTIPGQGANAPPPVDTHDGSNQSNKET